MTRSARTALAVAAASAVCITIGWLSFKAALPPAQQDERAPVLSQPASGRAAADRSITGLAPRGPSFSLSAYQSEVVQPTLTVLDGIERSARERGETALLMRVKTERTRVLRAAIGLPRTAPEQQERNDP